MNRPPAAAPMIPDNAPFSADQRAWLNGFFAGLMSLDPTGAGVSATGTPAGVDAAPTDEAEEDAPWHDPTLALPDRMAMAEGKTLGSRMMAAMAQQDCGQCGYNCRDYADAIVTNAEARLNLCVPGAKETARTLKTLAGELGGAPASATAEATPVPAKAAEGRPGTSRENPAEAVFLSRSRLNRDGSEKATYHIEFDLTASGLVYDPGDSFGLFPVNPPIVVDAVIDALHAASDHLVGGKTLHSVLTNDVALGLAPDSLFEFVSLLVGGERKAKLRALARGEDPDGDAATLDVLGVMEKFQGIRPDPEAFIEALEPLQPRLFSISSSLRAHPDRVSLTVDHVRYAVGARQRFGVASTFVGEGLAPGDTVRCYIQKAHDFALPADGATPIIMVGPGTGIAPFRSFLHERHAAKASGPAWLFFGHQRRDTDFFYEEELSNFQRSGVLEKLSLAWSRDGGQKVYVQDKMREEADALWSWLERGAHLYICGDAKRMAADVEKSLLAVAAEKGGMDEAGAKGFVKQLRATGRFQTDVY